MAPGSFTTNPSTAWRRAKYNPANPSAKVGQPGRHSGARPVEPREALPTTRSPIFRSADKYRALEGSVRHGPQISHKQEAGAVVEGLLECARRAASARSPNRARRRRFHRRALRSEHQQSAAIEHRERQGPSGGETPRSHRASAGPSAAGPSYLMRSRYRFHRPGNRWRCGACRFRRPPRLPQGASSGAFRQPLAQHRLRRRGMREVGDADEEAVFARKWSSSGDG